MQKSVSLEVIQFLIDSLDLGRQRTIVLRTFNALKARHSPLASGGIQPYGSLLNDQMPQRRFRRLKKRKLITRHSGKISGSETVFAPSTQRSASVSSATGARE